MDIGQLFRCYMDIVVKQCVKVPFGQFCSVCMCTKWVPKLWMLSEKSMNFWQKSDQNQSEQNQSEGNQNFLKSLRAPWSYFLRKGGQFRCPSMSGRADTEVQKQPFPLYKVTQANISLLNTECNIFLFSVILQLHAFPVWNYTQFEFLSLVLENLPGSIAKNDHGMESKNDPKKVFVLRNNSLLPHLVHLWSFICFQPLLIFYRTAAKSKPTFSSTQLVPNQHTKCNYANTHRKGKVQNKKKTKQQTNINANTHWSPSCHPFLCCKQFFQELYSFSFIYCLFLD